MQSIVSKGKNLQEAIQIGLDILEVKKDQVSIEIIQDKTKGIMGIGRKKAVVKLELIDGNPLNNLDNDYNDPIEKLIDSFPLGNSIQQLDSNQHDEIHFNVEGKVWVSNGEIHVRNSPMRYPMVTISKGIQLFINNELVKEQTTVVSEKDLLEIKLDEDEIKTTWEITIDKHKLQAMIDIVPGYKIMRKLQDAPPSVHLELKVEESKEMQTTIDYNEMFFELEAKQIVTGINEEEIMRAISSTEKNQFIIATGKKAEPGINGYIDLKIDTEMQSVLKEDESGSIDFRESRVIPTVDQGEVLGVVYPPVPGRPGLTVTNDILPPKPVYSMNVRAEQGVIMVENKIIATEAGRPVIQMRGQLVKASVMPKLVHQGNVNISSGNIHFDGDVDVLGEVEENMQVESGSDISVSKSVNEAYLTAFNSIVVKGNVASSVLTAGKNNIVIAELGQKVGEMHEQLEEMISVIKQLTQATAFKSSDFARGGLQPLISILLEKKFREFLMLSKDYVKKVNENRTYLEDDWKVVSNLVKNFFFMITNPVTSIDQLLDLLKKMKELHQLGKTPIEPASYITIADGLNSSLYSSGDIFIIGKGW